MMQRDIGDNTDLRVFNSQQPFLPGDSPLWQFVDNAAAPHAHCILVIPMQQHERTTAVFAGELLCWHPVVVSKYRRDDWGLIAWILQAVIPEGVAKACKEAVQQPACIKGRWGCCCQWRGLQVNGRLSAATRSIRGSGCWHRGGQALGLQVCHAHAGERVAAEAAREHLHVPTVYTLVRRWRVLIRPDVTTLILGVGNTIPLTYDHSKPACLAGR